MGTPAQYLQPGYPGGLLPGMVDTTTTTGPSSSTTTRGPERTGLDLSNPAYAEALAARKKADEDEQARMAEQAAAARAQAEREAANAEAAIQVKAETQARKDAAVQSYMAESGQLRDQLHAADEGKNKGYWEDKSTPARILAAVLVGMAEGANTQGGQSAAGRIMDQRIAEDRQLKMQKYESAKERIGESAAMHSQRLALIDSQQIVSLQRLADQLDLAAKKFPAKAVQLQLEAAQARQKAAGIEVKGQVDVADKVTAPTAATTRQSGQVTTTTGEKGTGPKGPTHIERTDAEDYKIGAEGLERAAVLAEKNPESFKRVIKARESMARQEAGPKAVTGSLQFIGVSPVASEQLFKDDPIAREINTALGPVITASARVLDPKGIINEGSIKKGENMLNLFTTTPAEFAKTARQFRDQSLRRAGAASPTETATPGNTNQLSPAREYSAIKAALDKNPNSPGAERARARLREIEASRGR